MALSTSSTSTRPREPSPAETRFPHRVEPSQVARESGRGARRGARRGVRVGESVRVRGADGPGRGPGSDDAQAGKDIGASLADAAAQGEGAGPRPAVRRLLRDLECNSGRPRLRRLGHPLHLRDVGRLAGLHLRQAAQAGGLQGVAAVRGRPRRGPRQRQGVPDQARPRGRLQAAVHAARLGLLAVRRPQEKRLRARARVVPAVPRRGHDVRPGAHHHVQAAGAHHHREQGGGIRGQLPARRAGVGRGGGDPRPAGVRGGAVQGGPHQGGRAGAAGPTRGAARGPGRAHRHQAAAPRTHQPRLGLEVPQADGGNGVPRPGRRAHAGQRGPGYGRVPQPGLRVHHPPPAGALPGPPQRGVPGLRGLPTQHHAGAQHAVDPLADQGVHGRGGLPAGLLPGPVRAGGTRAAAAAGGPGRLQRAQRLHRDARPPRRPPRAPDGGSSPRGVPTGAGPRRGIGRRLVPAAPATPAAGAAPHAALPQQRQRPQRQRRAAAVRQIRRKHRVQRAHARRDVRARRERGAGVVVRHVPAGGGRAGLPAAVRRLPHVLPGRPPARRARHAAARQVPRRPGARAQPALPPPPPRLHLRLRGERLHGPLHGALT